MAILDDIYDSLGDDQAWAALPGRLAPQLGGRSMLIQVIPDGGRPDVTWSYFTDEMMRFYVENDMAPGDLWHQTVVDQARFAHAFALDDFLSRDAFAHTPFYNECIRRFGDDTGACLGGVFKHDTGFISMGVHRPLHAPAFDLDHVRMVDQAMPHLKRLVLARAVLARSEERAQLSEGVLSTMAHAVALTDAEGRIRFANAAAEAVFARNDGLASSAGTLFAAYGGLDARLKKALAGAAQRVGGQGDALLVDRAGGGAYKVIIAPYRAPGAHVSMAMVMIEDPDLVDPDLGARLMSLYRLTRAEADLALRLLEGESVEEAAAARQVAVSTVRSQLKSLLSKTDTRRQSSLTALLARLPRLRRPPD